MKHSDFNRSPKQALSVREVNKPRTSRSTLSICGTPYFSGSYSSSTGATPSERKITEALLFPFSTAKELLFLAWGILGSWLQKSHIEFMMSVDLGSTISLYLSLVILRSSRSYISLPIISFKGRRHLLLSEARCAGMLCFWASKVKGRSCTTRALLLRVSEVCLWAELWVLQTGRLVSRSSWKLASCSGSRWHRIHSKHKWPNRPVSPEHTSKAIVCLW